MDAIETLLSAIDIIATKKLDEVSYDITKIGTVIDNSKSAQGIYMIQDGPIKYEAESENPNYRVDEMVRITIPQGDYTQKKYIVGKYTADSALKPITYVSPLETIVNITGNLLNADQASSSFALIANGDVAEMPIVYVDLKGSKWNAIQNTSIFNTFFVKAKFKCLLDNYKMKGGTYGLRFEFMIPVEDGKYSSTTFEFDNSEMFGDPYAFTIPVSQEKKIVADIGNAEKLFIYLYQKKDFKHTLNGTLIDVAPSMTDNIFVSDIEVGFGANVEDIEDGTLKLFFKNQPASLPYTYGEDGNNVKEFGICWLNKDDDNQYVGFSDGICDPDYDEFKYQEEVKQNQEIKAQMKPTIPDDMRALSVAAAINKGEPVIKTGVEILNKKIKSQLSKFKTQLNGIDGELSAELINSIEATIESVNTNTKDMKASYESILEVLSRDEKFTDTITNYPDTIVNTLTKTSTSVKTYLNKLTTDVLIGDKVGFYSIYDLYNNRLTPMLESLDTIVNQLDEIYTTTYSDLTEIVKDDYVREPFEELKIEDTANRYCIYWYEYDYINEVWKLIKEATNIGLPSGEAGKSFPIHTNEDTYFVKELNPLETKNEKFKVVLYYNHVAYESNVIEFTNNLQIGPSQEELMGKLTIAHGINSQENYQIYGEIGNLVNQADANKPRYLQADFKGYELDNNSLDQAQIFWYIPKNSTMLRYLEIDNKDKFIIDTAEENAKENYTCYYKQIKAVDGIVPDDELQFVYRVKDWYSATKNNDILCRVKKNDIDAEANVSFTFNKFGTCGSDYTLAVSPSDGRAGYTTDPFILEVKLYDYNGNEVEISGDVAAASEGHAFNLTVDKSGPSAYNFNAEKDAAMVSVHKANDNYYGIAEISVLFALEDEESDKRTIRLATNYPIAYAKEDYSYIEGATMVVYDSMGNNPAYYKDPYKLFNQSHAEVEGLTWSIKHYDASGNEINPTGFIVSYLPKLSENNCLVPCNMFVSKVNCYSVVYAIKDDEIYWAQPIVITQNRYASPVLNSWDGSLTIDEENGTILSTMVGAGRKTTNNTFEGVLMGDVGEGASLKEGNKSGIGLYGFHDGAQSFGFNIDGTAFLGKSGGGRIHFDGNYGFIYSQNWLLNGGKINYENNNYIISPSTDGMLIDLQTGYIDAYNFKLTGKEIYLNANPQNNDYYLYIGNRDNPIDQISYSATGELIINVSELTIKGSTVSDIVNESLDRDILVSLIDGGSDVIKIVDGKLYIVASEMAIDKLQSKDYSADNETGFLLDLVNNNMMSYNMRFKTQSTYGFIEISSLAGPDGYPLFIGEDRTDLVNKKAFAVKWDGSLIANNATISGTLTANANSKIGAWTIGEYKIYNEGSTEGNCVCMQVPNYKYGSGTTKWVFAAGSQSHDSYTSAKFKVRKDGVVFAKELNISGGKLIVNTGSDSDGGSTGGIIQLGTNGKITAGSVELSLMTLVGKPMFWFNGDIYIEKNYGLMGNIKSMYGTKDDPEATNRINAGYLDLQIFANTGLRFQKLNANTANPPVDSSIDNNNTIIFSWSDLQTLKSKISKIAAL